MRKAQRKHRSLWLQQKEETLILMVMLNSQKAVAIFVIQSNLAPKPNSSVFSKSLATKKFQKAALAKNQKPMTCQSAASATIASNHQLHSPEESRQKKRTPIENSYYLIELIEYLLNNFIFFN